MGQIKQLDAATVEQIAAGEVIERPASVVKELVENAIDARAKRIDIAIQNGGISEIIIQDNGIGIAQEDCVMAFCNHATSKLTTITDLHNLLTMGFRGEALSSIAAISRVTLISKPREQEYAYKVEFAASQLQNEGIAALSNGTQIIVRDLFYNVPARYKFLKKDQGEVQAITRIVTEEALAAPEIAFTLTSNGKVILQTPGNNDLLSTIQALFGTEIADNLLPITADENYNLRCQGFIGKTNLSRKSRRMEYFFINKRSFSSALVTKALEAALQPYLMTRTFPVAFLFLDLATNLVDVNVHPRKLEVRFWNENEVYKAIYAQIKQAMLSSLASNEPDFAYDLSTKPNLIYSTEKTVFTQKSEPLNTAPSNETVKISSAVNQTEKPSFATYLTSLSTHKPSEKVIETKQQIKIEPITQFKENFTYPQQTHVEIRTLAEQSSPYQTTSKNTIAAKPELITLATSDLCRIDGDRSELLKLKTADYIGQLHGTYLLFNAPDCLFILDQHAMHERINFENLKKNKDKINEVTQLQQLLLPYEFSLPTQDALLLQENLELLLHNGYQITAKGDNNFSLSALNITESQLDLANLVQTIISDLDLSINSELSILKTREDRILASRACRSSIMANDYVTAELVHKLLPDFLNCENPFQCPHGRPTCLQLKRSAIEKAFKRKL